MLEVCLPQIQPESAVLLLTPEERIRALEAAGQLANLSKLQNNEIDWLPPGSARLAMRCADTCLSDEKFGVWRKDNFRIYSWVSKGEASAAVVAAPQESSDNTRGIAMVAEMLGCGVFKTMKNVELESFMTLLKSAHDMIPSLLKFDEVVGLNTGIIVPYLCEPPSFGSGSALQIPGALLLPAGVPAVILAECWIHEALHTELHLAEWLEGSPPASSATDLPTPWRTVARPAALLLHGVYVFSSLLLFIDAMRDAYSRVPSEWHLSATKGAQIAVKNIQEVIAFRKRQIHEALECLECNATLNNFGKKTLTISRRQLTMM